MRFPSEGILCQHELYNITDLENGNKAFVTIGGVLTNDANGKLLIWGDSNCLDDDYPQSFSCLSVLQQFFRYIEVSDISTHLCRRR